MSAQEFHKGDAVEVLPATSVDPPAWRKVSGQRGVVGKITPHWANEYREVVFVIFPTGGLWCNSTWLRLVQMEEIITDVSTVTTVGDANVGQSGSQGTRYKIGDVVRFDNRTDGKIIAVDAEPRYEVQWPDGHFQRIKENTLLAHGSSPAPVKCAPDGTRCIWFCENLRMHQERYDQTTVWHFCPMCGGKLRKEDV